MQISTPLLAALAASYASASLLPISLGRMAANFLDGRSTSDTSAAVPAVVRRHDVGGVAQASGAVGGVALPSGSSFSNAR